MTEQTTLDKEKIHQEVRKAYAGRVTAATESADESCCSCSCGDGASVEESALRMGYSAEDLEAVPEGANLGLGCGAPLTHARVQPGETVLDLGSGAGFDAFIAARAVGPEGRVIGVDMTPEMVAKAEQNAVASGVTNTDFRLGQIESLPVADAEVDVIVSNCVINLSPDKPAVFREAFRALKPGGRLAVSDIVLTAPLPERVANSIAAYVGCLAGASLLDDYLQAVHEAGFEEVEVAESRPALEALSLDDPMTRAVLDELGAASPEELSFDLAAVAASVVSAKVVAVKPHTPS
ncbi:MAG: arsenite methyltransferase [Acidobacteria bacterium]|nr:MAG: arsenite methyltransferase [Acidobacteriota bacterium]